MSYAKLRESVEKRSRVARPNPARRKMLLAADDPELRSVVVAHFRGLGFDVVEARDSLELLRLIRAMDVGAKIADPPDVIVSDIRMPGAGGPDIVATLRGTNREIPMILMTALADRRTDEAASRSGLRVVFQRPFDTGELGRAVLAATAR